MAQNLRPFLGLYPSSDSNSDTEESDRFMYLESNLPGDSSDTSNSETNTGAPDDLPGNSLSENKTRDSSSKEYPAEETCPGYISCDQEIGRVCSEDLPWRPKMAGVACMVCNGLWRHQIGKLRIDGESSSTSCGWKWWCNL